jgi:hypothetical protein
MANKVYINPETLLSFGSEGTDDADWSTESITNNAGRQSAMYDLGVGPRALRYAFRFYTQFQATPTLGAALRVYMKTAGPEDSATPAHPDNDDGTGDAAVSAIDKLNNLHHIGSVIVDEAAANVEMVVSGIIEIPNRHVGFVFWNASGATVTTDVAETKLELVPLPDEIQ